MLRPRKVKHPPTPLTLLKSLPLTLLGEVGRGLLLIVFERENSRQLVIKVEGLFHLLLACPVAHVNEMLLTRVLSLRIFDALLEHARGVVDLTHRFYDGVVDIER